MASIYDNIKTARELVSFVKAHGMSTKMEDITNYDRRTYIEELGREAWGSIDYEQPLTPEDARAYELTEAAQHPCAGCVNEEADRSMDCCWDCNRNPRRKRQDLYRPRH